MYRSLTRLTALLMVALGLTMLVVTAWHGGGVGLLLGGLFVAAGAGRLWLLSRRRA
jgi:D-alanyl-lipoteichoic acid acyltransferase DltB (MBOAT superfamily)